MTLSNRQLTRRDRRAEPRSGERIPYLVVYGSPGLPLIRLVVPAEQVLKEPSLRLNAHYYISRVIVPPLQRCFGLLGVDVLSWYQSLPRIAAASSLASGASNLSKEHNNNSRPKATISQYFETSNCLLCDEPIVRHGLCAVCDARRQTSAFTLSSMLRLREKDYLDLVNLCQSCTGASIFAQSCQSVDCPALYRRTRALHNLQSVSKVIETLSLL